MDEPRRVLILASTSPRRRELLAHAGLQFELEAPDVDESAQPGEAPEAMAERVARLKAETVAKRAGPGRVVLAADTVVVLGGDVLGKPRDVEEASAMLLRLAGHTHRVLTGYSLRCGDEIRAGVEQSRVRMRQVTPAEARAYAATGEPLDKAGAYAVQGRGGRFVESIDGSRSNVIGLPIEVLVPLLAGFGVRPS
ncbi:MAG: septum formation inhibitor Maf [Deltaproteobacteria bacterium]|nr:septum formation inhibitor Maf [Deltaproteobacteria bacterium]MBW2416303.1 septum formation inhibitor Maf [Deltaproteobacteria bacterium]